ncbi:precorrin-3B C(17)-methyltransferase, partial [Halobacteriales archaeon QH_6_66_25]
MSTDTDTDTSTESKCGASKSTDTGSSSTCGASSSDDEEEVGSTVDDFDADPGRLVAVGLGPGQPEGMTQRAQTALGEVEHIVGYTTYIDLIPDEITEDAEDIYSTPMCGEVS